LQVSREKHQVTYKDKSIRITADFSKETSKARRAKNEVFQILKENNCNLSYSTQQDIIHN
jgi:hypothetical protein